MKILRGLITKYLRDHTYSKCFLLVRSCFHRRPSLIRRDFVSPEDYTSEELKSLLWSAIDLKSSPGKCIEVLCKRNGNITVLMGQPSILPQVAISNAVHKLGFNVNLIQHACLDTSPSDSDLGRALTHLTDIIVAVDLKHHALKGLADGASVPVVNFCSSVYQPIPCLANLMSVFEHYCFLQNLTLGWIGPWNAALNSYLIMCPKFGMNIQFAFTDDKGKKMIKNAIHCAIESGTGVHQKADACEAVYRAHVIATSLHCCEKMTISRNLVQEAAINWTLLPELPRSRVEVTDDVFNSKNNLLWASSENLMWVCTALFLNLLQDNFPRIPRPDFEGCNIPAEKYYQK